MVTRSLKIRKRNTPIKKRGRSRIVTKKPKFQTEILKKFQGKEFTTHDVMYKTHHSYPTTRAALNRLIEKGLVLYTGKTIPSGGRPEQILKLNMKKTRQLVA